MQGRADLKAAENSLTSGSFEWACFQAQQAGEKALKALWLFHARDPWGHSLLKLIEDFPEDAARAGLTTFIPHAKKLDKLYIPTRYPNGLPECIPAEVYTAEDARDAINAARELLDDVASKMA